MTEKLSVVERAALLNNEEGAQDLNKPAEKGSFERELPQAGIALLRLNSYIEFGKFANKKNPSWKPAVECLLTFELLHPNHMIKPEDKPAFPMTFNLRIPKSVTAGSRFIKLFNAMNWEKNKDGSPRHSNFNTMIANTAWRGNLHARKSDDGKKEYRNLNTPDGAWDIGAPAFEADPINAPGVFKPIPVAELNGTPKLFLWNDHVWDVNADIIQDAWDTLYIEGENDKGKSKNWIQDLISSPDNIEWNDSTTKQVVEGGGTIEVPDEVAADQDAKSVPISSNAITDGIPFTPDEKPAAEEMSDAAALAALGL